jgi:hypothetical protein
MPIWTLLQHHNGGAVVAIAPPPAPKVPADNGYSAMAVETAPDLQDSAQAQARGLPPVAAAAAAATEGSGSTWRSATLRAPAGA